MIDDRTAPYAALVLRVSMGVLFLAHAGLKVFLFTPAGTVGFFESLGLPGLLAYVTIGAEALGGLALIAGFYTRAVSLALVPIMIGAAWAHAGNGWLFSNANGGWEFPVFWTAALFVQALLGNGAHAVQGAGSGLGLSRPRTVSQGN